MVSGIQHDVQYFKRFRMEIDLAGPLPPVPALPHGCDWVAWRDDLLKAHAEVKVRSFEDEVDSRVFSNLGSLEGCLRLMHEIRGKRGFCPESTWLIRRGEELIGTIQGVAEGRGVGSIQNVGVIAEQRGQGLGTALVLKALHGFRQGGLALGRLEVTSNNEGAIRIYRRLGFRFRKTLYRVLEPLALVPTSEWAL